MAKNLLFTIGLGVALLLLAGLVWASLSAGNYTFSGASGQKTVKIMRVDTKGTVDYTGALALPPFQFSLSGIGITTTGPANNLFPFSLGMQGLFETNPLSVETQAVHRESGKKFSAVSNLGTFSNIGGASKSFTNSLNLPVGTYDFTFIVREGTEGKYTTTQVFVVNE